MALRAKLEALLTAVLEEAERNPGFAARLEAAISGTVEAGEALARPPTKRSATKRADPAIDVLALAARGEAALRDALASLTVDQLKDIVAAHALDRTGKALRWKTRARLIDLIVTEATNRMRKGGAFLSG